jgi:hypothetical protein
MTFVAKLRARSRRDAPAAAGAQDRDLVAFVNEARSDAERQAYVALAALRGR